MVGKKSGKALLREEGLERTDNNMGLSSWPQITGINQKNYYTDYLKRDDQHMVIRSVQEANLERATKEAKDKDRELSRNQLALATGIDDAVPEDGAGPAEQEILGARVIVIHPGSQNLRIGMAMDPLPKTIPMVIARKSPWNESEGQFPLPRREIEIGSDDDPLPEDLFDDQFKAHFKLMSDNLKKAMRQNKRKILPNSKELVVNYNRRTSPEIISEHNDSSRVDWTEIPENPKDAPDFICGHAALRIPDASKPRYKLFWPLAYGTYNEKEYTSSQRLLEDIVAIIDNAIFQELGIKNRKDLATMNCIMVIPDLYERKYVTQSLEMLIREIGFGGAGFVQESMAATFGAGQSAACVVDIGVQKTSVCCVDEGLCQADTRINLRIGGRDITDTFIKMLLTDYFPYEEINLRRRYDFLLAEELKEKFCTMNEAEISVQLYNFHVRVSGMDTKKYQFKVYDEIMCAPMCLFVPEIVDHSRKNEGRRSLIDRSYDIYDGLPNDPTSIAQDVVLGQNTPDLAEGGVDGLAAKGKGKGPAIKPDQPFRPQDRLGQRLAIEKLEITPRSSAANSPAPEGASTPNPGVSTPGGQGNALPTIDPSKEKHAIAEDRDRANTIFPLQGAILLSISKSNAALDQNDRKMKDYWSNIMVVGGGAALIPGFDNYLEQELRKINPLMAKDIKASAPSRELDPRVVEWKGASVFAKLKLSTECYVTPLEWDRLGWRALVDKCMWLW